MSDKREKTKYQGFFTQFLDYIPCGIFSKDLNSRFLGANKFLAMAAGFSDGKEIIGKSDYEMPWADETVDYHEFDKQIFHSKKIVEKVETIQL